jgi:exodeoxyribonuclease III
LNVAHKEYDCWNFGAKHLAKQAGLTQQERDSFQSQLDTNGGDYVDAFRHLYPEAKGHYSYWSQRAGNRAPNKGLRLDYFICSKSLFEYDTDQKVFVRDSYMIPEQEGSDHCPVVLEIEIRK